MIAPHKLSEAFFSLGFLFSAPRMPCPLLCTQTANPSLAVCGAVDYLGKSYLYGASRGDA